MKSDERPAPSAPSGSGSAGLGPWLAALVLSALPGYAPVMAGPSAPESHPDLVALAAAWQAYAAEHQALGLQFGCQPRHYSPPAGQARAGAVLLFHGFGGCPQQFFQLGPALAADGFDVLVPLLPGHGRVPGADGAENLDAVPATGTGIAAYGGLAARMNEIMALSPGSRVIVGYSLGGALALNATLRRPGLYERMLLLGPLLAVRGGTPVEWLAETLARLPGARGWTVKPARMQRECEAWTAAGRAGFCDYEYRHVAPLIELEAQNRDWLADLSPALPTQIIAAGDEPYVSNRRIRRFVERQRDQGGTVDFCLLANVPHEVLTPYENLGRDMHWLGGVLDGIRAYVTHGKPFPRTAAAGDALCQLRTATSR
jgi:alpha-beta hydrolase superfamily lysophospholipase